MVERTIVVIDGQGGRRGKQLIERIKARKFRQP
jgi:hypothetical protein